MIMANPTPITIKHDQVRGYAANECPKCSSAFVISTQDFNQTRGCANGHFWHYCPQTKRNNEMYMESQCLQCSETPLLRKNDIRDKY